MGYFVIDKIGSQISPYGQSFVKVYCIEEQCNPILWKEQANIAFKTLQENLMNPHALGHWIYQMTFFLFIYEEKGNTLGVLSLKHGDHLNP